CRATSCLPAGGSANADTVQRSGVGAPKHAGRYRKATVLPRQARERCRLLADICHAQAEATVSAFSMPDAGHGSDHNINFTLACGGIASRPRRYPIGRFKKLSGIVVGCVNRLTGRYLAGRRQVKAWFLVLKGPGGLRTACAVQ